jgi:hypothetical protein
VNSPLSVACRAIVQHYSPLSSACAMTEATPDSLTGGGCSPTSPLVAGATYSVSVEVYESAGTQTCAPSGVVPVPAGFNAAAATCGALDGGAGSCAGGERCIVAPRGGFVSNKYCVVQVGNVPCPGGLYVDRHLYYTQQNDSRTCSPCSCGAHGGASCSAAGLAINAYEDTSCATNAEAMNAGGGCGTITLDAGATALALQAGLGLDSVGACPPSGGAPSGSATPLNPTTVCCTP